MSDDLETMRTALLTAGFRTIGCAFDGSGDEGRINDMVLPERYADALADILDDHEAEIPRLSTYYDVATKQFVVPELLLQSTELMTRYLETYQEFVYNLLEAFPGDWVNNEGGFGVVYVDLATGTFFIDGEQRYSSTETATAEGLAFTSQVTLPTDDLGSWVSSILQ